MKSDALQAGAMVRAEDLVFEGFGPTLLHEHLMREPTLSALDAVHVTTFRLWMIEAGR